MDAAKSFLDHVHETLGPLPPLLLGILPLANSRHAAFLHNEVPGLLIPETIRRRMDTARENAPAEGIKIAIELVEQMRADIQGVYLMPPFNRFDTAAEIIDAVKHA